MRPQSKNDNPLKQEPLLHLLLWSTVLLYPYIKFMEHEGGYSETFLHEINSIAFIAIPSYAFYSWWLPLPSYKRWRLLAVLLLIFITSILGFEYTDSLFHPGMDRPFLWRQLLSAVVKHLPFVAFFFGLYIFKGTIRQRKKLEEVSEEKQQAELSALKAQVTPHFLFNTLNGLYADALKVDDALAESILRLSDNTRYFLKEGQQEQVSLKQELTHIDNYIELQQRRLTKKVAVAVQKNIEDSSLLIAPLILIPFVENAFKYSSMLRGEGHKIDLEVTMSNGYLLLNCTNPFDEKAVQSQENEWMKSGIGLTNIEKRLALLYPGSHQLTTSAKDGLFSVQLKIEL